MTAAPPPLICAAGAQLSTPAGRPLLRLADWRLEGGAQLAITGASGCGKSTLLQAIAGLHPLSGGSLEVCGLALSSASPAARARLRAQKVGLVMQGLNLLPALSAIENVALGAIYSGIDPAEVLRRARGLLDAVGLADRARDRPAALSLGEQQRVAVARALVHGPALVLADEPTASLDPAGAAALISLLAAFCAERGAGLLLVTHDPTLAARLPAQRDLGAWRAA